MTASVPTEVLQRKIAGAMVTQMIAVAARLGIADLLKDGPMSAAELSARCDASPDALYRIMRALAAEGLFHESVDGAFALTPVGEALCDDAPGSQRMWAMLHGAEWLWNTIGGSMHSVSTGQPAFPRLYGMGTFQYFSQNEEHGRQFYETMTRHTEELLPVLLERYDFSSLGSVIDVGGGHGALLAAVLGRYPEMKGVLFDLPTVLDDARAFLTQAGVAHRTRFVGGDFFEAVPGGADGYLLKFIIHDWNDGECRAILRNCRKGIAPDGRLLVLENVLRPRNEPCPGKLLDLTMLLVEGGRERTEEEFARLFADSGFELTRIVPLLGSMCVVEGRPV